MKRIRVARYRTRKNEADRAMHILCPEHLYPQRELSPFPSRDIVHTTLIPQSHVQRRPSQAIFYSPIANPLSSKGCTRMWTIQNDMKDGEERGGSKEYGTRCLLMVTPKMQYGPDQLICFVCACFVVVLIFYWNCVSLACFSCPKPLKGQCNAVM